MPIGTAVEQQKSFSSYKNNELAPYAKAFLDYNNNVFTESSLCLLEEPKKALRRDNVRNSWKKFFVEGFLDEEAIGLDPTMDEDKLEDEKTMLEQLFDNDVKGMNEAVFSEAAAIADYNPVIGIVFPMHKNILMNMVYDKGAIQKVVAPSPKFTLTMENRYLVTPDGEQIDMFLDQNKMTDAILDTNPMVVIEVALPENETVDIVAQCGGSAMDDLSIRTHISHIQLENVYIAEGDYLPNADGVIDPQTSAKATAAEAGVQAQVWIPVNLEFTPGYSRSVDRDLQEHLTFTVKEDIAGVPTPVVRKTVISAGMTKNKLTIFSSNDVVKAVRVTAELDTANAMLDTCTVTWDTITTLIEIGNAIPINTTITPNEVKDLNALYQVNQLTKIMSLFKTAMANYKNDMIERYLDKSYGLLGERYKGYGEFDYAPPQTYALDHVEWRYKTFMDFFDTQVQEMLYALNDPNVVITTFGDPDLVRKITPTTYAYQSPSSIGPVNLDFTRTVTTSDKRVYQFIGSDTLRHNDNLRHILTPRNSDRVTYRIYDYQMYVSNEIRNHRNPVLPAIHAFERWEIKEYQAVQSRTKILNRTGMRPTTTP